MLREALPGRAEIEGRVGAGMWKAGKRRRGSGFRRRWTSRWGKQREKRRGNAAEQEVRRCPSLPAPEAGTEGEIPTSPTTFPGPPCPGP